LFAGDRVLYIGSKIKGFLKYFRNWIKNSLYTTVCVTNEHNTSQTRLLCFRKKQYSKLQASK
ncbi:hypothetical protein BCV72DRAFT_186897, partial [Rhizopus microsporus var. microsporus]